jgi:hypothetical protein
MTTQWNTRAFNAKDGDKFADILKDEHVVLLMQGKNMFGDRIYSYLKVALPDIRRLQETIRAGQNFNPSDFGTVVAAGKGDPTDEVKAEIAASYKLLDNPRQFAAPPAPKEEKPWDEY